MTGKEYADKEYSNIDEGLKGIIAKSFDTGKGDIADLKANFDYVLEGRDVKIKELEKQIEKLKAELDNARESANRQEQWEIYSVLNALYNDNFEITKGVSN